MRDGGKPEWKKDGTEWTSKYSASPSLGVGLNTSGLGSFRS